MKISHAISHLAKLTVISTALVVGPAAIASGDKCDNFDITVSNASGYITKITKVEYKDFDHNPVKWRSETLSQKTLQNNVTWIWERDLEHVGGDNTQLKITYKKKLGGLGNWSGSYTKTSNQFTCRDNSSNPNEGAPIVL